ncbi:MAG: hypothetical protein IJ503_08170 [Akkermansia sp.]|nr:hypothetical protein [Akkermansia sp.]
MILVKIKVEPTKKSDGEVDKFTRITLGGYIANANGEVDLLLENKPCELQLIINTESGRHFSNPIKVDIWTDKN